MTEDAESWRKRWDEQAARINKEYGTPWIDLFRTVEQIGRAHERRCIERVMAIPAVDGKIKMADIREAVRGG